MHFIYFKIINERHRSMAFLRLCNHSRLCPLQGADNVMEVQDVTVENRSHTNQVGNKNWRR
jgi:hypothetical protein